MSIILVNIIKNKLIYILSTYKVIKPMWPKYKFFKNDTLKTSLCESIVLRQQFLFSGYLLHMFNDLITID